MKTPTPAVREGVPVRVRLLATGAFRAIVWLWCALGLACILAEGLLSDRSGSSNARAAPIERSLITPYGASLH